MLFIERTCLVKAWLLTVIWSFVSNVALPFTVVWTVAENHLDRTSSGEGRWCGIVQVLVLRSGLKFWLCFVLSVKSCLSKSSVFRVWGPLCDYQDLLVCKETYLCSSSPTVGLLVRCVDTSINPAQGALRRHWLLFSLLTCFVMQTILGGETPISL